ncbi:MAG: hypothetical protein IKH62_05805 [Methanobrevibacter sp.]|nr:hypothetical protein [Methanobrevibacter sp.]
MDDKITYEDVKEYESIFKMAPSFLLERFARKNTNFVLKFQSQIQSRLNNLNPDQKDKLDLILRTDVLTLQHIMHEAYLKSKIKQYKILANPKYRQFVESNLAELRKMIE